MAKIKAKRPQPVSNPAEQPLATQPVITEGNQVSETKPEGLQEEQTTEVVEQTSAEQTAVEESSDVVGVNVMAGVSQGDDPVEDGTLEEAMEKAPVESAAEQSSSEEPGNEEPEVPAVPAVEEAKAPVVQEPVSPAAQAPAQEPEQAAAPAADRKLTEEEAYLDDIRVNGTVEQKRMLAAVETFAQQLKPKMAIDPEKGAKYQHEFLKHLLWILEKEYEAFRGGWNVLLVYFFVYHGTNSVQSYTALSEFSTTRFMHSWTKGQDACNAYRNLITLLRATRKKETRKHDIKTINLQLIAPNVLSEKAINNLKQFYSV